LFSKGEDFAFHIFQRHWNPLVFFDGVGSSDFDVAHQFRVERGRRRFSFRSASIIAGRDLRALFRRAEP
jgi:hypothetical protein